MPTHHHYRLFGLTLGAERVLASSMRSGKPPADVTFSVLPEPPAKVDFTTAKLLYESPFRDARHGDVFARLYRTQSVDVLRFVEGLDVYCSGRRLDAFLLRPGAAGLVEIRLLGPVLSYWLERSGLPVLHASAVDLGGRAVAFLADNRGGKSSLAAGFLEAGHALLTDDLLAVERVSHTLYGRSGYPQMRFWRDAAERFWDGDADQLPRVHPELDKKRVPVGDGGFGRFQPEARPLAAIYLPRREDDPGTEIRIEPIPPSEALIELIRRSFIPRLAAAAGWEVHRFGVLGDVAEQIPVRRLVYPGGYERLSEVVERLVGTQDLS